jgi:hypothetical protein
MEYHRTHHDKQNQWHPDKFGHVGLDIDDNLHHTHFAMP